MEVGESSGDTDCDGVFLCLGEAVVVSSKVILQSLCLGNVLEQQMDLSFVLETMVETNEVRVVHFAQQLYFVMNSFLFLWLFLLSTFS